MSYKMNGSPAKLGTIKGTSGHKAALQNASPNKGLGNVWDKIKGAFSKKVDTSKYDDMTDEQLEAERSKRSKIQELAKSDKKSGKKKIDWNKEFGDFWRVSRGGPWNEPVKKGKKNKKNREYTNTDHENRLAALEKFQNKGHDVEGSEKKTSSEFETDPVGTSNLSDKQFRIYQNWKKDNPHKNIDYQGILDLTKDKKSEEESWKKEFKG